MSDEKAAQGSTLGAFATIPTGHEPTAEAVAETRPIHWACGSMRPLCDRQLVEATATDFSKVTCSECMTEARRIWGRRVPPPPRLTDVEAQHLATRVITAPDDEVPKEIGRLAAKVLELLARVPHDVLAPQPPPANPPRGAAVWPLVISRAERRHVDERVLALMRARDAQGRVKYGVPLSVGDGRDTRMDAIQEALDLIVYLAKLREEGGIVRSNWIGQLTSIVATLVNGIESKPT